MGKREVADLQRKISEAERVLDEAKKGCAQALQLLREGCPHAGAAVELNIRTEEKIGRTAMWKYESVRFCVECGFMEERYSCVRPGEAPQFSTPTTHRANRVYLREFDGKLTVKFLLMLDHYRKRLHEEARFDEFDDDGHPLADELKAPVLALN